MILKRSGARKLLAEAEMTAGGTARYYRIEFPVDEAKRLAEYIAQRLSRGLHSVTHLPPGKARGLEPETVGDQFIRQFGDPETYAATRHRKK